MEILFFFLFLEKERPRNGFMRLTSYFKEVNQTNFKVTKDRNMPYVVELFEG